MSDTMPEAGETWQRTEGSMTWQREVLRVRVSMVQTVGARRSWSSIDSFVKRYRRVSSA